ATQGVSDDKEAFDRAMEGQRDKARADNKFGGGRKGDEFPALADEALKGTSDQFEGYTSTRVAGVPVVALFDEQRQPVDALESGSAGFVALARTPFYVEAGGQVSDSGRLVNEATGATAIVEDLSRIRPGLPRAHRVRMTSGALHPRDIITAEVDAPLRDA